MFSSFYANDNLVETSAFENLHNLSGAPNGQHRKGTFWADVNDRYYNKKWPSMAVFEHWMAEERARCHIDFVKAYKNAGVNCDQQVYSCSSGITGGDRKYQKKDPETQRKVPSRKTDCPMILKVKTYPNIETVLGHYEDSHNHDTSVQNLKFVGISSSVRDGLHIMANEGRTKEAMLEAVRGGVFSSVAPGAGTILRDQLVISRDVAYYQKASMAVRYQHDRSDTISVFQWTEKLAREDAVLAFKPRSYLPEQDSPAYGLRDDAFVLILQWPWQREIWAKFGTQYMGVDGTHNTTFYKNMMLHTIMARDEHGHGVPVCWMLASNGEEATFRYFFRTFRTRNSVSPAVILSDRDQAQIKALSEFFPNSEILLCWWHVMHDFHGHLDTAHWKTAKPVLRSMIRAKTPEEHEKYWEEIKRITTPHFITYMETTWRNPTWIPKWVGYHRNGRSIYGLQDTNMIVESYHNFLKNIILGGSRNRRIDFLIWVFVTAVRSHYVTKQLRQFLGFEGLNLGDKARRDADKRGLTILKESIELAGSIDDGNADSAASNHQYNVRSQSDHDTSYFVDNLMAYCSCPAFKETGIDWCKHLSAVCRIFGSPPQPLNDHGDTLVPVQSLDDPSGTVTQNHEVKSFQSSETSLLTVPRSSLSNTINGDHLLRQIRHIAASSQSFEDVPQDILDLVSQSLNVLRPYAVKALPGTQKVAPNIRYPTENALPPKNSTKASRKRNTDAYSGGTRAGKNIKKGNEYSDVAVRQTGAPLEGSSSSHMTLPSIPAAHPRPSLPPCPPASQTSRDNPSILDSQRMYSLTSRQQTDAVSGFGSASFPALPQRTHAPLHHANSWSSLQSQQSISSLPSSSSHSTTSLSNFSHSELPFSQSPYHSTSTASLASNYGPSSHSNDPVFLASYPSSFHGPLHHHRSTASLRYHPYPDANLPTLQASYLEPSQLVSISSGSYATGSTHWDQAQSNQPGVHSTFAAYRGPPFYGASTQEDINYCVLDNYDVIADYVLP